MGGKGQRPSVSEPLGRPPHPARHRLASQGVRLKYGLNAQVVHPHSFRHLFAKNFLDRRNDLPLLADILGHVSISTTRIYLRKSTQEQRDLINQIVDW